jgi:hypothetical protein
MLMGFFDVPDWLYDAHAGIRGTPESQMPTPVTYDTGRVDVAPLYPVRGNLLALPWRVYVSMARHIDSQDQLRAMLEASPAFHYFASRRLSTEHGFWRADGVLPFTVCISAENIDFWQRYPLESVQLTRNVTDDMLAHFPLLTSLHCNDLISDAGLAHFPLLTSLHCGWNKLISDAGLAHVPLLIVYSGVSV